MSDVHPHASIIMTVRNDADGCATTLSSLSSQTVSPKEIVVVDGGSSDGTTAVIRKLALVNPAIRLIESPGANIARGRNLAVEAATGDIIACIDAGCRAEPDWLEKLLKPFDDPKTEFVAGFYQIEPETLLEEVVGLATMRGQLDVVDAETFNPSARSLALTKSLWKRAGGWPDWLDYSEDTLFDHKVRRMKARWTFARQAVVYWRPRGSLRALARQFYNYGTGRGLTQIGAADFAYNLRNLGLVLMALLACRFSFYAVPIVVFLAFYFYVWTFHGKSMRIARRTGRPLAYPLSILVMWTVLFSNLAGYLLGSWKRWESRRDSRIRKSDWRIANEDAA